LQPREHVAADKRRVGGPEVNRCEEHTDAIAGGGDDHVEGFGGARGALTKRALLGDQSDS
jgi:hypothetical protein